MRIVNLQSSIFQFSLFNYCMFTRFTERARKVIVMSRNEASRLKSESLDCEHLFLGLLKEGEGVAVACLQELRIPIETVRREIESKLREGAHSKSRSTSAKLSEIPFTLAAKKSVRNTLWSMPGILIIITLALSICCLEFSKSATTRLLEFSASMASPKTN